MNGHEYQDWARQQECIVCLKPGTSEASHVKHIGMGGDKKKPCEEHYSVVSMCNYHHAEYHMIGKTAFEQKHSIDLWKENGRMLRRWLWGLEPAKIFK